MTLSHGARPSSSRTLSLNSKHYAGPNSLDGLKCVWQQRQQILERIAHPAQYDNADLPLRDVLLKLKILIAGDEDAETGGLRGVEQRAVFKPRPRLLLNGSNLVANQERPELPWELLIGQNAHAPLPLHARLPKRQLPVPSTRLERRPGIGRGCDYAPDSR